MNIAFIGYGQVGLPLADHLQRLGHTVTLAARNRSSEAVTKAVARNPAFAVADPRDAVAGAQVVFLATPFSANDEALSGMAEIMAGKVLIDCTNPVGPGISHGLKSEQSGAQSLQALLPGTYVVKAFSIYGFENLEDNHYPDGPPVMLYCGDDLSAKATAGQLIAELGWDPFDVGGLAQALHLEHMTLLWVRLVRLHGHNPNLVWKRLTR